MKSPLADKDSFKSAKILKELIPVNSVVESYLLYSGEMELSLCAANRLVIAHTSKYPLYEFWWMAKNRNFQVASMAQDVASRLSEKMLYQLQESWYEYRDPVYRAALFYILNRCSDVGRSTCGSLDLTRLTPHLFRRFKMIDIQDMHFILDKDAPLHRSLNTQIQSDIKFFPVGKYTRQLLHREGPPAVDMPTIDHNSLLRVLADAPYKWVILYKYNRHLLGKLSAHNVVLVDKYGNHTVDPERCEDIIATNF